MIFTTGVLEGEIEVIMMNDLRAEALALLRRLMEIEEALHQSGYYKLRGVANEAVDAVRWLEDDAKESNSK